MILKSIISNTFIRVWNCHIQPVRQSALFINRAKATEQFVYVIPHIDIVEKLQNKELLLEQLSRRESKIDIKKLLNLWSMYEELNTLKSEYDKKKDEISKEYVKHLKDDPDSDITKKLKMQMDLIKDNIKKIKLPLWSAEEAAMVEALGLPNCLHPRTPDIETNIIYNHSSPPKVKKDHLTVGKEMNLLDFKNNENYYLKGDAAIFELGATFYFNNVMKQHNAIQFSNPDFVKSLIVEGCGGNHTSSNHTFILHHNEDTKVNMDSRLHLTGGASLCSFLAYHTKNVLYGKVLPLRYFTMGRQYAPSPSDKNCLFHVSQSSVIEYFGVTKNENDLDQMLDDIIDILKLAYSKLGYHFRLCIIPANKLLMWESLRVAVEMYSTSLESYVEVAYVSLSGEFISKRLLFTYTENKKSCFPHLLSGTLLNVPKLLGCVLEQEQFALPEVFKVHNWSL